MSDKMQQREEQIRKKEEQNFHTEMLYAVFLSLPDFQIFIDFIVIFPDKKYQLYLFGKSTQRN